MRAAIAILWPVIATVALVQLANGVQSDLVSVRGGMEGFGPFTIGLVMASYYVGYSAAPLLSRWVIARAGHVWTIAGACVSAALLIFAHAVLISPLAWGLFRVALGLSLSLLYVSIESWINDVVENAQRGRVFGSYVLVQMVSMTAAQALFEIGNPGNASLFLLAAALFALGALPVLAAIRVAPSKAPPEPFGIVHLFRVSPLGAIQTALAGVSWAVVVTFGPLYAKHAGLSVGLFMGFAMVGGLLLQFPLGWLSDHIGRRRTIVLMAAGSVAASLFGLWANSHGVAATYAAMFLIGAVVFTLYAIAVARTNDDVAPQNRVAAAAGLVMLFGLGSIAGPPLSGEAVTLLGAGGFFVLLAAVTSMSLAAAALTR